MNRDERLARAIAILHRGFSKEADDLTIEAYAIGCEGVPIETIERGVKDALKTAKFMPTPAELCGRVSLRRPGQSRCGSCGVSLSFAHSLRRGFCKSCWYAIGGEDEDKQLAAIEERKAIQGEP